MLNYPTANIEALLVAQQIEDFYTSPMGEVTFDFDGILGNDRHIGRTRVADMRVKPYVKDHDIVLDRQQVSMVDVDSLDYIADELELDEDL